MRIVGISLVLVLVVALLIALNLRRKGTNYLAVLSRMMTNYLQIISFAASFNLGWPSAVKKVLQSLSFISDASENALSLDCFFDNCNLTIIILTNLLIVDLAKNTSFADTPTYFIKALLLLLLPAIALVIILSIWGAIGYCKRHDKLTFARNILVSFIVVVFLAHPTLTSTAFSMINCYEIEDGEFWLQANLDIKCWNSLHKKWFFFVGVPMLIVWVLGTPIVSFFILFRNRKNLNDEVFFGRYRMLY